MLSRAAFCRPPSFLTGPTIADESASNVGQVDEVRSKVCVMILRLARVFYNAGLFGSPE